MIKCCTSSNANLQSSALVSVFFMISPAFIRLIMLSMGMRYFGVYGSFLTNFILVLSDMFVSVLSYTLKDTRLSSFLIIFEELYKFV
jgi:hypothetical protein